jgi:hypothetical protein
MGNQLRSSWGAQAWLVRCMESLAPRRLGEGGVGAGTRSVARWGSSAGAAVIGRSARSPRRPMRQTPGWAKICPAEARATRWPGCKRKQGRRARHCEARIGGGSSNMGAREGRAAGGHRRFGSRVVLRAATGQFARQRVIWRCARAGEMRTVAFASQSGKELGRRSAGRIPNNSGQVSRTCAPGQPTSRGPWAMGHAVCVCVRTGVREGGIACGPSQPATQRSGLPRRGAPCGRRGCLLVRCCPPSLSRRAGAAAFDEHAWRRSFGSLLAPSASLASARAAARLPLNPAVTISQRRRTSAK